jgi:hypothetical protein
LATGTDMKAKPLAPLTPAPGWEKLPWRVLTGGVDTYAETWNITVGREAREAIERAKAMAIELDPRQQDGMALDLGACEWRVLPHGAKGGVVHVLASPEMLVMCRAWVTEWCITVRYLSAGIWEQGLGVLRKRAADFLAAIGKPAECEHNPRVTRCDYAIDVHAPGFAPSYAMADAWVFPQGTAKMRVVGPMEVVGRSRRPQTFTLGKITGLQVQLYDKVAEIREASGKDWFRQIWGGVREDVWRVEARFSGAWLKERHLWTWEQVREAMPALLATALHSYRLTAGEATRARRANVHPLWWRAIQFAGASDIGAAVVNLSTMRRVEFRELMVRNLAGSIRAAIVAHDRDVTADLVEELVSEAVALEREDRTRDRKIGRLQERHKWIDRPA